MTLGTPGPACCICTEWTPSSVPQGTQIMWNWNCIHALSEMYGYCNCKDLLISSFFFFKFTADTRLIVGKTDQHCTENSDMAIDLWCYSSNYKSAFLFAGLWRNGHVGSIVVLWMRNWTRTVDGPLLLA